MVLADVKREREKENTEKENFQSPVCSLVLYCPQSLFPSQPFCLPHSLSRALSCSAFAFAGQNRYIHQKHKKPAQSAHRRCSIRCILFTECVILNRSSSVIFGSAVHVADSRSWFFRFDSWTEVGKRQQEGKKLAEYEKETEENKSEQTAEK